MNLIKKNNLKIIKKYKNNDMIVQNQNTTF